MKKLFVFGMMISSTLLQAEVIQSKIHAVEGNIVKFENGRVAFTNQSSPELHAGSLVSAVVDENSNLVSSEVLPEVKKSAFKSFNFQPEENTRPLFEPTVVPSMEEAWNIFNRSNPNYKRISECSDRAHVWAHDELKFSGTKSMKAFVFFTASYINSVRFKWWFHVAPMYKVATSAGIQDMVMDFRYTDRPMTVKEWTDQFVYTKRPCKMTTKFSEYDVNPQTENCYMIFESMHYKIPGEIHDQETQNRYKSTTTESEIKASYRYAFQL